MTDPAKQRHHRRRVVIVYLLFKKTQRYLPPVLRGLIGLLLVLLGFVGFLPIVGFWMIPLGLAVMATDIPPLKRWVRRRIHFHRRRIDRLR